MEFLRGAVDAVCGSSWPAQCHLALWGTERAVVTLFFTAPSQALLGTFLMLPAMIQTQTEVTCCGSCNAPVADIGATAVATNG